MSADSGSATAAWDAGAAERFSLVCRRGGTKRPRFSTAGWVHRDLKPENIIVVADPVAPRGERIKVLDFGIAKLAESTLVSGDGTRPSLLMGTPRYMSPEQCRGGGNVDAKSDVYALGVMMYQLISGKLPFESNAAGELIVMHIMDPPPSLLSLAPELPPALARTLVPVIERLLTKAAAARPSMSEVAQQLQALSRQLVGNSAEGLPTVPRPAPAPVIASTAVAEPLAPGQLTVPVGPASDSGKTQPAPPTELPTEPPTQYSTVATPSAPNALLTTAGSSTLGNSVGQLPLAPTARRRYVFLAPAAFLLVVGVLIVQRSLSPAPARPGDALVTAAGGGTAAAGATGATRSAKQWQLGSDPTGASVVRKADGKELGKTPLAVDVPAPGEPLAVELRLAGFVTMNVELHPEDGPQRLVHLSADNRPPAPRPSIAKKKEKAKGGKSFFDRLD